MLEATRTQGAPRSVDLAYPLANVQLRPSHAALKIVDNISQFHWKIASEL